MDEETAMSPAEEADGAGTRKQHDLVFKTLFRHFFGDVIELAEPDFAARVDLTSVELLDQETFSDFPEGKRQAADLVAKLTSRDGEGRIVLVQIEVEGEFRSAMDERAFYYFLYLRAKYRLPVLLIVVFLRGGQKALAMREHVDLAESVEVCRFRYVAFCLGQSRAEEYVERPQPLAAGLAALMKSQWDPVQKKMRCLQAISHAPVDEARRFLLAKLVDLYVELDEAQRRRFVAETRKDEEVRKMVITWEETLAEREARGVARGVALGEARGLLEATRKSVLRVLQRRFTSVPATVSEKLDAIGSVERLEGILDQALTVRSLDELSLDDEKSN
ncbi:MAG TPA: hypothetical protein VGG06_23375 [Thermoanaerobaculia bacterium]